MTHARLLALLALPVAPASTALTGTALAAPASTLNGAWKGKLDGFYELDAGFTVQGNNVSGVLRFAKMDFPLGAPGTRPRTSSPSSTRMPGRCTPSEPP